MTDQKINELVAEKVAGWRLIHNSYPYLNQWMEGDQCRNQIPDYVHDANAVIGLLSDHHWWGHSCGNSGTKQGYSDFRIIVTEICKPDLSNNGKEHEQWGTGENAFCRAACLALLKAHGVEVKP